MLRLLRVHPGEEVRVGLMLVYSVAAVGGVVITGQLVGRALFLGQLPAADIPYRFILPPLAMMAVASAYGRVADLLRRDHLIAATCLLLAAGVVALRWLLVAGVGDGFGTLCGLYVFTDVAGALVVLQFWTFAGDIFDPREGRRLFGLITAGSTLSNLVFGLGLSSAAAAVAPAQLLFVVAASLGVCALCALLLGRRCTAVLERVRRPREASDPATGMRRDRLVLTLAGLVLTVAVVSCVADYMLDLALRGAYGGDSAGILGFLARFRFWAGTGALTLQFFVAGHLVDRFGIVAGLALLPLAVAGGSMAVLAVTGALWAAAVPRAADVVLKYTVHDAALNLLYLPLGDRLRARAKAVLDGVLKPPVTAVVGLVFLWAGPGTSPQDWALPLLVISAGWLVLAGRARSQYVDALARSLQLRRVDLGALSLDLRDAGSVRVVRTALRSHDPMRVTHALGWLEHMETVDWTADVTPLATHPSPEVRAGAVSFLGRAGGTGAARTVEAALLDRDAGVRRTAVEVLGAVDGEQPLRSGAGDPDPEVRAAVARVLLRRGDDESGGALLRRLTAEVDPAARIAAAGVLPEATPVPGDLMDALLADPVDEVVSATLHAAARCQPPPPPARLVPCFSVPRLRPAALQVARAWARTAPEALVASADDPATPEPARLGMVDALSAAEPARVAGSLCRWLEAGDGDLRAAALRTTMTLRDSHRWLPASRERLWSRLELEAREADRWQAARAETAEADDVLLDDALEHRWCRARDRVLRLLDLLHDPLQHGRLSESLASGDRRRVAAAVELVDQVLPRRLSAIAAGLAPSGARPGVAGDPGTVAARLDAFATGDDPWLAACAARAAGHSRPATDPGATPMPLSVLEKVFFLKSVPLFQSLPGEEIAEIVPIVDEVEFAAGDTFIRIGEEGHCLYILVDGHVSVDVGDGRERRLTSREVIGELAVLGERPRSADCRAVSDVVALRIDKEAFLRLLDERPGIAIEVVKALVARYVPPGEP